MEGRHLEERDDDLVRCLACGTTYRLPTRPASLAEPRGCPACGYVGWIAVSIPIRPRRARRPSSR